MNTHRSTTKATRRPQQCRVSPLFAIARDEVNRWKPGFRGVALAVLFCFIHRVTTGKTFEESFNSNHKAEPDYQI
jgi:hypothetical protein